MRTIKVLVWLFGSLNILSAAIAQPIAVANPGFETPLVAECAFIGGFGQTGWVLESGSGAGVWRPGTCWDVVAPEGFQIGFSNGATVRQTLASNAVAGQTYLLSFQIGRRSHPCCPFATPTIQLLAGATLLGSLTIPVSDAPAPGSWRRFHLIAAAPAGLPNGQPLIIRFSATGSQVDFDDFHLNAGATCPADFNGDGSVNSQDFFDFLAAFFASNQSADFNGDGSVNSQDFFDFLAAFFGGC